MTDYITNIITAGTDLTADCSTVNLREYAAHKAALASGEIDAIEFNTRIERMLLSFDHLRRLKFWLEVAKHEGALP